MFPLSAVLFPQATMPLHVFEPRYRELMRDCLAGDRRFGIVLIERGSEVGGGDARSALGTRGVITEASELPDGRWVMLVEGEALIMVEEWLPDDPYPVAIVRDVEPAPGPGDATPLVTAAGQRVRRARALLAEQGGARPLPPEARARRPGRHRGGLVATVCAPRPSTPTTPNGCWRPTAPRSGCGSSPS